MKNADAKWTATQGRRVGYPKSSPRGLIRCAAIAGALALSCRPDAALAGSGFLLRSQSATTLGTAQAGMSTNSEDMTAMVFNPALLGYAKSMEIDAGVTPIFPAGHFDPTAARTVIGSPIAGNSGGEAGLDGYPVNVYFAVPIDRGLSAGLAITSLYGLGFEYDPGWVGRYHAQKSELVTLDIVPTLAYRTGPLSLGLGIDVKYARAKTTAAIDFGTIAFVGSGGSFGVPAGNDGSLTTRLDDWGVGVIIGATYDFGPQTRVGLSYRSRLKTTLTGDADFDTGGPVGQAVALGTGQFSNTSGSAPLTFPAAVIAGVDQKLTDDVRLLAGVQWTQWSSLSQLALSFGNPAQQPVVTDLRWRDSWYLALGLRYQHDERWTWRVGAAYDQTPTRPETQTPAIPDADSVWLTLGGSYAIDGKTKVDFAYGHIFVQDNPISLQASAPGNAARGTLEGTITGSSVNFFGVQISHKF